MAQGFVKSLNLLETPADADAGILNNLGGEGIVDDIRLFSGNTLQKSTLYASEYTVDNGVVVITAEGRVPFSNRTIVSHEGTQYQVVLSNAIDRFSLRTLDGYSSFTNPTSDLVRSDAVTFENLANMSVSRIEAVRAAGSNVLSTNASENSETGIYNLFSIAENYSYIEEGLSIYNYKRSRIPLTFQDTSFNKTIKFNGNIRITNNANDPTTNPDAPGLFISGPSGAIRAFSDTSNPWQENVDKLETTANVATANDLVLNAPNLVIPTSEIQSESGDANDYTHKMKVMVKSGSHTDPNSSYETFYLLLST